MKYNTAFPYFPAQDIRGILADFKGILLGKGLLTMGEQVKKFENKFADYTGVKYAIAANSCTAALETVLRAIGLEKGDEVIVPAQTFIATGSCVIVAGGRVVFCEIDDNFLLDFEDLKRKVTSRTKAVIIVHFAGLIHPEIFEIKRYLKKKNIYLIEDAAHAHGAKINGVSAGNIGDFGCFSFYSTKIITTGEGGMITTNDKDLHLVCSSLRNRGLDVKGSQEIFSNIGTNGRITEFQGILGIYQLKRLTEFVKHRNKIADIYREGLKPLEKKGIIDFQKYPDNIRHAYWRFLIFLKNSRMSREDIKNKLAVSGIKIDWPYEPLLHLQPVFKKIYGIREGFLKKTEAAAKRHFCIPIHFGIKKSDARFISDRIIEAMR